MINEFTTQHRTKFPKKNLRNNCKYLINKNIDVFQGAENSFYINSIFIYKLNHKEMCKLFIYVYKINFFKKKNSKKLI